MLRLVCSTVGILTLFVINTAGQSNPASSGKAGVARVGTKGTITLIARDVETGYAVPAEVSYGPMGDWSLPSSQSADSSGRIRLTLPVGVYLFEMCAPGYELMRSYYPVTAASSLTFQMDPTIPPVEERPEVLDTQVRPGYAMTFGYVVDDITGKPLANVRVRWETRQIETRTNERGYYALFAPVPPADPNALPPTDTLVAEVAGYSRFVYHRLPMWEGQSSGTNIELRRGSGTTETSFTARWMDDGMKATQAPEPEQPAPNPISPKLLQWLSVPSRPCP